jgi:hypothetical protein
MLNYLDKMSREGYAVFVGDDSKAEPKAAPGASAPTASLADGVRARLARPIDPDDAAPSAAANAAAPAPAAKPTKAAAMAAAKAAARAAAKAGAAAAGGPPSGPLDYSRFERIAAADAAADEEEAAAAALLGGDFPLNSQAAGAAAEYAALEAHPLWATVLQLAGGDGARALELLHDPDALQRRPEIIALFDDNSSGE